MLLLSPTTVHVTGVAAALACHVLLLLHFQCQHSVILAASGYDDGKIGQSSGTRTAAVIHVLKASGIGSFGLVGEPFWTEAAKLDRGCETRGRTR